MPELLEGSQAVARCVARCRPQVVPAYPITPQTHIVETLGRLVARGELTTCRFLTVDSEFAALSAAIGASAMGSRAYTATASQGLLYMSEVLYNAAGLGLPIVMTVANRAIGAPINIWNDHSDSMSQRDAGWVQLHAADNQDAVDLHVLAFRLAEQLSLPVMVCMDGFVLTHATEPIDVPPQEQVDAFLPSFRPRQELDPLHPVTIGAMVGPEAFTEVRYLADRRLCSAQEAFAELTQEWQILTGRSVTPVSDYRLDGAETAVVAMGSVAGTVQEVVNSHDGVGLLRLGMYRPFPYDAVRRALIGADRVIVLERSVSPGSEGPVTADVRAALDGCNTRIDSVVAGLGGRSVTRAGIDALLSAPTDASLCTHTYLELHEEVVADQVRREIGVDR
jgi:pyruvate ferredoxin oxidoreductase alpha subunit